MAAINTLDLAGMTPDVVYQKLQTQGISQVDASLLVSGWIYQNFGNVQRTFAYALPFAAIDTNCGAATFARSFHHADWVDGSSVVQAQQTTGEDGFNLRFHRIENDIDGLATEIAKLYACVAEMRSELHDRLTEIGTEINRINSDLYHVENKTSGPVVSQAPGRFNGLINSPAFLASTKLGAANVTLWQTDSGIIALPATVPLAGDPVTDQRVVDAADFGRLVASDANITAAFGTAGLTKAAFVEKFGSDSTASGKTVSEVLANIPDTATFMTPQALADAVSQANASSITASTANLPGVIGVALGTTAANAAAAKVDSLSTLTPETRAALQTAGIDTVGKLAAANPADVTTALKTVTGVSAGDVGAIISTAKTISFLSR